jgi:hypothetical protein
MKLFLRLIFAAFLINTGCKQPATPLEINPWSVLTIRLENYEEINN